MPKITRYGVMNDPHGPYCDDRKVGLVLDVFREANLTGLYLNGDIFDFGNLSRHAPRHPNLKTALEDEFDWGNRFFEQLRKDFLNKKKRVIFKKGNHEIWLDNYIINNCPIFWNICRLESQVNLKGFEISEYNVADQIENTNLWVQHSPPSYAVAGPMASLRQKADASFIWGCTHRMGHATITGASGRVYQGWFNGWLGSQTLTEDHEIAFRYRKNHETWQSCAAIVTVVDGKHFFVNQFNIDNYMACVDGMLHEAEKEYFDIQGIKIET